MYDYSKLRGRIIEKYGTMTAFSVILGVSKQSVSMRMTGKTAFKQCEIIRWSELLDIEPSEYGEYFFARKVQHG